MSPPVPSPVVSVSHRWPALICGQSYVPPVASSQLWTVLCPTGGKLSFVDSFVANHHQHSPASLLSSVVSQISVVSNTSVVSQTSLLSQFSLSSPLLPQVQPSTASKASLARLSSSSSVAAILAFPFPVCNRLSRSLSRLASCLAILLAITSLCCSLASQTATDAPRPLTPLI